MDKHIIPVQARTITGRGVKQLRAAGLVPAHIFGKNLESISIQLNSKDFSKLFKKVGESALFYLQLEDNKSEHPVLVKEVMVHPVSGQLLHISFYQVDLKTKVTTKVPVELVGESAAQKDGTGVLVQQLDAIEIEALPTDIPEKIQLDITGLSEVGSSLHVSDISVNTSKVTILTEADALIVQISALAKEEVAEPVAPAEGAEGEAAAPAEGEAAATEESKSEEKSE